jgi:DNA-binding SARP family transcriptional activator/tetratricopeptide (TPR) repeat protein
MTQRIPATQGCSVADEQPDLRIRLFGHVAVEVDGVPFRLATPRKTLPILAYLLMNRDAPVAREFLAYVMWPDEEEESARSRLRMNLYELGRILPPSLAGSALLVTTDSVGVRSDIRLWLDVEEFDRLVADPERADDAAALYRGDLLASLYDEWILPERERRRNLYLAALTRLVSEARRRRDFHAGLERAQRILSLDPWREDIVRQVMALRSESGDRAGALSEYERFAQLLRTELGVDPMPETMTVREAIARGEPVDGYTADDATNPAMLARATLPFVGRRSELERLLEAWSRVARGRGACVFVGGEAGVGKSRLAIEFAHAVEERGGRVMIGATGSPEAIPYESVVDALRSALPLLASLKPTMSLACVSALLPEIRARIPSLPNPPSIDAESERARLFESVFRCLSDLSTPRPTLVVLEDLQWAQAASVSLLQFLLRRISGVRVMIVVTYRDEATPRPHPLHRLRQESRAAGSALSLSLSPLSIGDLEQLTGAMHEIREIPATTLLATSAGNPLFVTQLVDDYRKGGRAFAPENLQALISHRVERLSPDARSAAEIAAYVGMQFSRDVLREVSGWDEGTLGRALDELIDRRIARETSGRGLFEYAFAHHLLHDAVLRAAPPERAASRRQRIARVLEELYPDSAAELSPAIALHYELAGDARNAVRCYLAAVGRSIAIGALAEARSQCDRAFALATDPRQRAALLLEIETIEFRRGERRAWHAALVEVENATRDLDDSDLQRVALMRRIEFALTTNDGATHELAIRELRARAQDGDLKWRVALNVAEAKLSYALGQLAASHDAAQAALAASREARDDAGAAQALRCLANVEAHRGRLSEAESLLEEAGRAAADASDPVQERETFRSAWIIAYQRRDMPRCIDLGTRWLKRAAESGDKFGEAIAHSRLGIVLASGGGRAAEAREHFATATAIFSAHGNVNATAGELLNQSVLETRLGFFDRARVATEKAVELFEDLQDARGRLTGLANLALVRGCEKDLDGARSAANEALTAARELGFGLIEASALENLAFAEGFAGDFVNAIAHGEASLEARVRSQSEVWSSKALADLAIWHAALGNLETALACTQRMLAGEESFVRSTEWPEYCYWSAAQVFRLHGDTAVAARMLQRAARIMEATASELDPEDRDRFLAIVWNRDIAAAVASDRWPNPPR